MNKIVSTSRGDTQGMVVLSGSNGWLSKVIRWFTKSNFSHASILLGKVVGITILKFEAQERGVIPYVFTVNKKKRVYIYKILVDQHIIERHLEYILVNFNGKPYPFANLPGFAISKTANFFGIKMKNPFHGGHWCSKLGQYYVNEVTDNIWYAPSNATPEDMFKIFSNNPEWFKLVGISEIGEGTITWIQ